jgi:hypothetical protein
MKSCEMIVINIVILPAEVCCQLQFKWNNEKHTLNPVLVDNAFWILLCCLQIAPTSCRPQFSAQKGHCQRDDLYIEFGTLSWIQHASSIYSKLFHMNLVTCTHVMKAGLVQLCWSHSYDHVMCSIANKHAPPVSHQTLVPLPFHHISQTW